MAGNTKYLSLPFNVEMSEDTSDKTLQLPRFKVIQNLRFLKEGSLTSRLGFKEVSILPQGESNADGSFKLFTYGENQLCLVGRNGVYTYNEEQKKWIAVTMRGQIDTTLFYISQKEEDLRFPCIFKFSQNIYIFYWFKKNLYYKVFNLTNRRITGAEKILTSEDDTVLSMSANVTGGNPYLAYSTSETMRILELEVRDKNPENPELKINEDDEDDDGAGVDAFLWEGNKIYFLDSDGDLDSLVFDADAPTSTRTVKKTEIKRLGSHANKFGGLNLFKFRLWTQFSFGSDKFKVMWSPKTGYFTINGQDQIVAHSHASFVPYDNEVASRMSHYGQVFFDGDKAYFPVLVSGQTEVTGGSELLRPLGVELVEFDLSPNVRPEIASVGVQTLVSGSINSYFNGSQFVEMGFTEAPVIKKALSDYSGLDVEFDQWEYAPDLERKTAVEGVENPDDVIEFTKRIKNKTSMYQVKPASFTVKTTSLGTGAVDDDSWGGEESDRDLRFSTDRVVGPSEPATPVIPMIPMTGLNFFSSFSSRRSTTLYKAGLSNRVANFGIARVIINSLSYSLRGLNSRGQSVAQEGLDKDLFFVGDTLRLLREYINYTYDEFGEEALESGLGLYTVDKITGSASGRITLNRNDIISATYMNGVLYGRSLSRLYTINTLSGICTQVGSASNFGTGVSQTGAEGGITNLNGTLYTSLKVSQTNHALHTINKDTGVAVRIGSANMFGLSSSTRSMFGIRSLANYRGKLYGMIRSSTISIRTPNNRLHEINKDSGSVINTNDFANYFGSVAIAGEPLPTPTTPPSPKLSKFYYTASPKTLTAEYTNMPDSLESNQAYPQAVYFDSKVREFASISESSGTVTCKHYLDEDDEAPLVNGRDATVETLHTKLLSAEDVNEEIQEASAENSQNSIDIENITLRKFSRRQIETNPAPVGQIGNPASVTFAELNESTSDTDASRPRSFGPVNFLTASQTVNPVLRWPQFTERSFYRGRERIRVFRGQAVLMIDDRIWTSYLLRDNHIPSVYRIDYEKSQLTLLSSNAGEPINEFQYIPDFNTRYRKRSGEDVYDLWGEASFSSGGDKYAHYTVGDDNILKRGSESKDIDYDSDKIFAIEFSCVVGKFLIIAGIPSTSRNAPIIIQSWDISKDVPEKVMEQNYAQSDFVQGDLSQDSRLLSDPIVIGSDFYLIRSFRDGDSHDGPVYEIVGPFSVSGSGAVSTENAEKKETYLRDAFNEPIVMKGLFTDQKNNKIYKITRVHPGPRSEDGIVNLIETSFTADSTTEGTSRTVSETTSGAMGYLKSGYKTRLDLQATDYTEAGSITNPKIFDNVELSGIWNNTSELELGDKLSIAFSTPSSSYDDLDAFETAFKEKIDYISIQGGGEISLFLNDEDQDTSISEPTKKESNNVYTLIYDLSDILDESTLLKGIITYALSGASLTVTYEGVDGETSLEQVVDIAPKIFSMSFVADKVVPNGVIGNEINVLDRGDEQAKQTFMLPPSTRKLIDGSNSAKKYYYIRTENNPLDVNPSVYDFSNPLDRLKFQYFKGVRGDPSAEETLKAKVYQYACRFKWIDQLGIEHRSNLSDIVSIFSKSPLGEGSNGYVLKVDNLQLTNKDKDSVSIEVYRTEENLRTFKLLTELKNQQLERDQLVVDKTKDEDLGQVATPDNVLISGARHCIEYKGRFLLYGFPEKPNRIVISSPLGNFNNHAIDFKTQGFTGDLIEILMDDRITCIRTMDQYITIHTPVGVYTWAINEGSLSQSYPSVITALVRLFSLDSVSAINIAEGVLFQSEKGIWLVSRSLQGSFIGKDIQDFDGRIRSLVNVSSENETRIVTSDPDKPLLVYNYRFKRWSVFTGDIFSATNWQSKYTVLDKDKVLQESEGESRAGTEIFVVETGWINFSQIQNFQRLREITLLADAKGLKTLSIGFSYDFLDREDEVIYYDPRFIDDDVKQFLFKQREQKCTAVKLKITAEAKSITLDGIRIGYATISGSYIRARVNNS